MGVKDLSEKNLQHIPACGADIINAVLFEGKQVVEADSLELASTETIYKDMDFNIRNQHRDVCYNWNDANVLIASCGIENQTEIDTTMPVRIMGYDYCSYKHQLDKGLKNIKPVYTIVLNYNSKPWGDKTSLKSLMSDTEPYLLDLVEDYHIKVVDIANLSDDYINRFKGTFKHVAHFFSHGHEPDYKPLDEKIEHINEFLDLLAVYKADERYLSIKNNLSDNDKEDFTMCEILDRYINKGLECGLEQGLKKGELTANINLIKRAYSDGKSIETIVSDYYLDEVFVNKVIEFFADDSDRDINELLDEFIED